MKFNRGKSVVLSKKKTYLEALSLKNDNMVTDVLGYCSDSSEFALVDRYFSSDVLKLTDLRDVKNATETK